MSPAYRIVYIASMTHSGSTLLDMMVSAHSRTFSVGEVFQLADYAHARRVKNERTPLGNECTCGAETVWQCAFWPAVDRRVRERSGRGLRDLDVDSPDPAVFRRDNKLLFDAVAAESGAGVIVDSSKLHDRLAALIASGIAPVIPIHLRRDPRGQVHSVIRRTGRAVFRPSLRYALETAKTALLLAGRPHLGVAYEDLVADPAATLKRVMAATGLAFEPEQLSWSGPVRHNLSGNVMRKAPDSRVASDEAWRTNLSLAEKAAILALTLPATALARFSEGRGKGLGPDRAGREPALDDPVGRRSAAE